eukprot:TRINITY_DN9108_c0_g4_i1.p1 TRINITY_DN9108_c0_g4~~TRINITY_DN9108_c0_g4_i1.p1  ORF type:complete len:101 (+),score=14.87 TRINITY_DN9108_c0_g4_i1:371-673(+)
MVGQTGPTANGTSTPRVAPGPPSRSGVLILDQGVPVAPQRLSTNQPFSSSTMPPSSKVFRFAHLMWVQVLLGRPRVHNRIHGPDLPSSGPCGPTASVGQN